MKKEEKTELTRKKIINAAMEEFGAMGYHSSSLNAVCKRSGIPKGLIYHNFEGKDNLYLICMEKCFSEITAYLKKENVSYNINDYIKARYDFFSGNPLYARLFFEAILQPPPNLCDAVRALKKDFDSFNRQVYKNSLKSVILRKGVSEEDAWNYYELMLEMFNGYFSSPAYMGMDFPSLIKEHEKTLEKTLDFMLYGIAEKGDDLK